MPVNWEYAAKMLWPKLTAKAKEGGIYTYGDLGEQVIPDIKIIPLNMRLVLAPIQDYCWENNLPKLTALVVNKDSGKPGAGFKGGEIDEVYAFNWETIENPFRGFRHNDTTKSLAQRLSNSPEEADSIYKQVKDRGVLQSIFRKALLNAYDCRCAICGLGFKEALEAAHIIPWWECEDALRISTANGILLCANHHKLFDSKVLLVTGEYKIEYQKLKFGHKKYFDFDTCAVVSFEGEDLQKPKCEKDYPDQKLLTRRYNRHKTKNRRDRALT